MKSDKPGNLNLLRNEIAKGKLGKFKVAEFPYKFQGTPYIQHLFKLNFYLKKTASGVIRDDVLFGCLVVQLTDFQYFVGPVVVEYQAGDQILKSHTTKYSSQNLSRICFSFG